MHAAIDKPSIFREDSRDPSYRPAAASPDVSSPCLTFCKFGLQRRAISPSFAHYRQQTFQPYLTLFQSLTFKKPVRALRENSRYCAKTTSMRSKSFSNSGFHSAQSPRNPIRFAHSLPEKLFHQALRPRTSSRDLFCLLPSPPRYSTLSLSLSFSSTPSASIPLAPSAHRPAACHSRTMREISTPNPASMCDSLRILLVCLQPIGWHRHCLIPSYRKCVDTLFRV